LPFDEKRVETRKDWLLQQPVLPKEAEINGAATPLTDNSTKSFY
jgi:hypothetical protein